MKDQKLNLRGISKLNNKEMVNMNRELNLNELNEVTGGRKHTKEEKAVAKDKYNEMLEKIDTLKSGYHGSISRGSQVYSLLKSYEKQAKKYKRQSKR